MKLFMEEALSLDGTIEDELNESTGNAERNYYISGIFSTPEVKNRNGRSYPRKIWETEVQKYQKEIKERSVNTLGEWQHPPRSTVDPLKAVMRIVELKINEDGNVWGKAKILNDNSEYTNKLKGLIKEGIKIGVSSRGVGKVSSTGVVEDFNLITYDAVDLPSDFNAMLNGVVEGVQIINGTVQDKEYYIDEKTGCVGECSLDSKDSDLNESKEDFSNVEFLKTALSEHNAEVLCELSLTEKEKVLNRMLELYETDKLEKESTNEDVDTTEETVNDKLTEEQAKKIVDKINKII